LGKMDDENKKKSSEIRNDNDKKTSIRLIHSSRYCDQVNISARF